MTDKSLHSWQETKLWSEILRRTTSKDAHGRSQANNARRLLETLLPNIEAVLSLGGTSSLDFTLHDAQHSFRVAERIQEITPTDVFRQLHSYELVLLLLAAYLHDIGMTPKRRKVGQHYEYLLSGSIGDLSSQDVDQFQAWLDDEGEGIVPPLAEGQPTPALLRKAGELTTYYCRFRHNDWSEEWIRSNMADAALGNYLTWCDNLVVLCRSHHDGYTELLEARFDAG